MPERWWLDGEETCNYCSQIYAHGTEFRCHICDAAVCPECVVIEQVSRLVFCSRCEIEAETGSADESADESTDESTEE